jgi:hypothetical protein
LRAIEKKVLDSFDCDTSTVRARRPLQSANMKEMMVQRNMT